MSEGTMDVLVAGYRDVETAQHDLDALTDLVKRKQVKVEGVILVANDEAGEVTVVSTGDHLGRKGAEWGGGVGLAVGLFQPELLAATAVGAAGGAVVGKFVDHKLKSGIQEKIGENLPPGSAGIIAVYPSQHRLAIEQALPGSPA
jgi:arylsulfatase